MDFALYARLRSIVRAAALALIPAILAACVSDGPAWKPYDADRARALAAEPAGPEDAGDLDHALARYYAVSPGLGDQFAKVLTLIDANDADKARVMRSIYDYFEVASVPGDGFFEEARWDQDAGVYVTFRYLNSLPKKLRVNRMGGIVSANAVTPGAWVDPQVLYMGYLNASFDGGQGPDILEVRFRGLERDLAFAMNGEFVVVPFEDAVAGASFDVEGGTLEVRIHGIGDLPTTATRRHIQLRSLVRDGWGSSTKASRPLLALFQDVLDGNDDPMRAYPGAFVYANRKVKFSADGYSLSQMAAVVNTPEEVERYFRDRLKHRIGTKKKSPQQLHAAREGNCIEYTRLAAQLLEGTDTKIVAAVTMDVTRQDGHTTLLIQHPDGSYRTLGSEHYLSPPFDPANWKQEMLAYHGRTGQPVLQETVPQLAYRVSQMRGF